VVNEKKIENAIKHISKVFNDNNITTEEIYIALPDIIVTLFEQLNYNDFEKQKQFFKNLEEVVYEKIN